MAGKAAEQKRNKIKFEHEKLKLAFNATVHQNQIMLGHLLTIAIKPESEDAKELIEHYKAVFEKLKQEKANDTINSDSNPDKKGTVIPIATPASDLPN